MNVVKLYSDVQFVCDLQVLQFIPYCFSLVA